MGVRCGSMGFDFNATHNIYKLVVLIKRAYEPYKLKKKHWDDISAHVYNVGLDQWTSSGLFSSGIPVCNIDNFLQNDFVKDVTYIDDTES